MGLVSYAPPQPKLAPP